MRGKKYNGLIIQVCQWLLAGILAFIAINAVIIPYYHFVPGIPMDKNATGQIYYPGSTYITAAEGYRKDVFDVNGYVNDPKNASYDEYTLVMGSSHTMGKVVEKGNNFCELLDERYGIPTYNMAMDGHLYPDFVAGFEAALKQFDRSTDVVIELNMTLYDINDLKAALTQREYDPAYEGKNITKGMSGEDTLKAGLGAWLPFKLLVKQKIDAAKAQQKELDRGTDEEYYAAVDATMKLMRQLYDKPIIILYHPDLTLDKEGNILYTEDEASKQAFIRAAKENDIVFEDITDEFSDAYLKDRVLPYGFMNTSMGTGHINRTGHEIIAGRLKELIEAARQGDGL